MKPQFEITTRRHPILRVGDKVTGESVEVPGPHRAQRPAGPELWVMETKPGGSMAPHLVEVSDLKPLDDAARAMMMG